MAWFATPVRADNGLTVKVYACPTGQAQAVADQLRTEFGLTPGVRIAADPRTNQVVIQAPPEIQARISQRHAEIVPAEKPAAAADQPSGAPAPAGSTKKVSLRYVKP